MKKKISIGILYLILFVNVFQLSGVEKLFDNEYDLKNPFEFRKELIGIAEENKGKEGILDAGRGEPNFFNTYTRNAYSTINDFAMYYVGKKYNLDISLAKIPAHDTDYYPQFLEYLKTLKDKELVQFINESINYAKNKLNIKPNDLIYEMVINVLGCKYPDPSNISTYNGKILNAYIKEILFANKPSKDIELEYFAVEGASAGLVYLFSTLKDNCIIKPGDSIALITPIFTPYVEMTQLADVKKVQINLEGNEKDGWNISSKELKKLHNKDIKILYLINPANPTSSVLSQKTIMEIKKIIKEKNQDLIIVADYAYASFANNFNSIIAEIPFNTIGVYSFSKFFGVTGWRVGAVMMQKNGIMEKLLSQHEKKIKKGVCKRYENIALKPEEMSFIDRLSRESRKVTFCTNGLSGPQQCYMTWCSLFHFTKYGNTYKNNLNNLLNERKKALFEGLDIPLSTNKEIIPYYVFLNLFEIAQKKYGDDFAEYLNKNIKVEDFLRLLARDEGVVCLLGKGFDGPKWSIRISLANLTVDKYKPIGEGIIKTMLNLYNKWDKKTK